MAYARAQTIMLLSCKKVCFWLQVREKGRKEAAEWCLVSIRQVWNWCNKDTNISVSNLFNLADFLNCRPEDCWRREIATIFCREYLTNFCRR